MFTSFKIDEVFVWFQWPRDLNTCWCEFLLVFTIRILMLPLR